MSKICFIFAIGYLTVCMFMLALFTGVVICTKSKKKKIRQGNNVFIGGRNDDDRIQYVGNV